MQLHPGALAAAEGQRAKIKSLVAVVFESFFFQWLLHLQNRFVPQWITKVLCLTSLQQTSTSRPQHNTSLPSHSALPPQTMTYQALTKFKYE